MTSVTKDYALHMISEVTEVVQELSWRMHRASKGSVDRGNLIEELVDVTKFTLGLIQCWGFTYEQFHDEFKRKSMVVEQRWAQEQSLPLLESHPCVLVDIDGVLADWDAGFYNWLRDYGEIYPPVGTTYAVRQWYSTTSLQQQEDAKRRFRQSGAKADLKLLPGASDLLFLLRQRSQLKIVLLTNRPYAEHYRIYPDTLEWLEKNQLPYDAIVWAHDKGLEAVKQFKNIAWAVDDKPRNVKRLREARITTVHLNPDDPENDTASFTAFVNRLLEDRVPIENAAHEWNKRAEVSA